MFKEYVLQNGGELCKNLKIGDVEDLNSIIRSVKLYIIVTADGLVLYSGSTKLTLENRLLLHRSGWEPLIVNAVRSRLYSVTLVGLLPEIYQSNAMNDDLMSIEDIHNNFLKLYMNQWDKHIIEATGIIKIKGVSMV